MILRPCDGTIVHRRRDGCLTPAGRVPTEPALESLAEYLAVKKQNPDVLRKLKTLHQKMCELAQEGKVSAYINLNRKFHATLIHASENKRLIELINTFDKQTLRYRIEAYTAPGWMNESIRIHEAHIHAFESGDAKLAEKMRKKTILKQVKRFSHKFSGRKKDTRLTSK